MRANIILFIMISSCIHTAIACDKSQLKPSQALNEADVVFRGKVENLQYLDDPNKTKTEPRIIVTFSATEVWKGKADKTISLHTTHNKSTCNGFVFKAGEEYLVYAGYNRRADNFLAKLFAPDNPALGVKVYGGTKLITEAKEDLAQLGKAKQIE